MTGTRGVWAATLRARRLPPISRQKQFPHKRLERSRRRVLFRPRLPWLHVPAVDRRGHFAEELRHISGDPHSLHRLDHLLIRQLHICEVWFSSRRADHFRRFGVRHLPWPQPFLLLSALAVVPL